jgi:hypothetical protein
MDKTIIFCTENKCPEPLFRSVVEDLKNKAGEIPIVSISHKPINLGMNICIGEHRRSWVMLYRQLLLGCKAAKTRYITIAEHDCFYTEEHLAFIPPTDTKFYYNENIYLLSADKIKHPEQYGMFSRFWTQRLALSQMVCNREIYLEALERRLDLIDRDRQFPSKIDHLTEPGASKVKQKLLDRAEGGSAAYLRGLLPDFIELEKYEVFNNKIPNIDVRHGVNFTGPRWGRERTFEVPYWGTIDKIIKEGQNA